MDFAKYLSVIAASTIKFVGGPITGLLLKLTWIETAICSIIGMMLTVISMIFLRDFSTKIRKICLKRKPRRKFTHINRTAIKIRQKFGLTGIAFVTPLILTPAGGTLIALAFRYSKSQIILSMFLWSVIWAIIQSLFFFYADALLLKWGVL